GGLLGVFDASGVGEQGSGVPIEGALIGALLCFEFLDPVRHCDRAVPEFGRAGGGFGAVGGLVSVSVGGYGFTEGVVRAVDRAAVPAFAVV
ncbi:hypothetical protein NL465_29050, partial [Klebsiella pneumoniae]|nr:hypothetical protein [Klebsiella pneumoniae]